MMIAATVEVEVGLEMLVMVRATYMGGWPRRRDFAGAERPERQ